MKMIRRHLIKCFVAGIAALLPIGGTVMMVLYFEQQLSSTWLKDQPFYKFGMGILLGGLLIYLVGLAISTFIGRWAWARVELLFEDTPLLGPLYQTFKQLLGYGEGPDAMFKSVVKVPCIDFPGDQLGFVTAEIPNASGELTFAVFVPAAPNPTNGRLIYVRPEEVTPLDMPVNEAMKALISAGALPAEAEDDDDDHSTSASAATS